MEAATGECEEPAEPWLPDRLCGLQAGCIPHLLTPGVHSCLLQGPQLLPEARQGTLLHAGPRPAWEQAGLRGVASAEAALMLRYAGGAPLSCSLALIYSRPTGPAWPASSEELGPQRAISPKTGTMHRAAVLAGHFASAEGAEAPLDRQVTRFAAVLQAVCAAIE